MNNIVKDMNKYNILRVSFGLYPSFVAGILNSMKKIHFGVVCELRRLY